MTSSRSIPLLFRRAGARANDLGAMSLRELIVAYVTWPSILLYWILCIAAVAGAVWLGVLHSPLKALLAVGIGLLIYPIFEYALHRYVLHNRWLYRNPFTANLWKRIHYDHHQDPNRLDVLFGSPTNTLPAIATPSLLIGYAVGGWPSALIVLATALLLFSFYEFCHCVQHLNYTPKSAWLRRIKKNHMAHHFHSEQGNFGITTNIVDHLVGSYYENSDERPRSVHVYDLGYDAAEQQLYPWVAERSGPARGRPRVR